VAWDKQLNKWRASADRKFLGLFTEKSDAALNYDFYMLNKYGFGNCYLNFPEHDFTNFVPKKKVV
jgi:hypothetical protein